MHTNPSSGVPIPRSQRPKAMSSLPSFVSSQVREELHDGSKVDVGLLIVHSDELRLAVGDVLFGLPFGEECHFRFLGLCGPEWPGHKIPGT
jgi:hypothetical protein